MKNKLKIDKKLLGEMLIAIGLLAIVLHSWGHLFGFPCCESSGRDLRRFISEVWEGLDE